MDHADHFDMFIARIGLVLLVSCSATCMEGCDIGGNYRYSNSDATPPIDAIILAHKGTSGILEIIFHAVSQLMCLMVQIKSQQNLSFKGHLVKKCIIVTQVNEAGFSCRSLKRKNYKSACVL
jgi:hypothetical protein